MKPHFLVALTLTLAGASIPVGAQQPFGSRALSRGAIKKAVWPRFQTGTSGVYLPQYLALQFLLRNQGFLKGDVQEELTPGRSRTLQNAVKTFQRTRKIHEDGFVGAQTWGKLCPVLKQNDRGDVVRALQTLLDAEVDGVFGFETKNALRQAQKSAILKADGIVGAQTWASLLTIPEPDVAG